RKVSNSDGITLWQDRPEINPVISQQTARSMMILLRAVTDHRTGAAVAELQHPLGGKTGTTSDFTDAWFLGFSPSVTCGVWVGYDSRQSLGEKETGAKAALPIWLTFMKAAIAGKDEEKFLSDTEDEKTLKAASEAPGMPANVRPAVAAPPPPAARTVRASTALRPAAAAAAGISEED